MAELLLVVADLVWLTYVLPFLAVGVLVVAGGA
jgi:hypothetical protein